MRNQVISLTLGVLALLLAALPLMIPGLGALAVPAVILAALSLGMHFQGALAASEPAAHVGANRKQQRLKTTPDSSKDDSRRSCNAAARSRPSLSGSGPLPTVALERSSGAALLPGHLW
jgi:membrane protein implicated in regulation of membrane protease activity